MTAIDARVDPAAATQTVESVLAEAPAEAPATPTLPDTNVELPGGYLDATTMSVVRTATVRELNGEDEEAILRHSGNLGKTLETILQRGVESVGAHKATPQVLDALLAADLDALLVHVRAVTFGPDLNLVGVTCPHCQQRQDVSISCTSDIPIVRLEDPADRNFEMTLQSGKTVKVALPDGGTQRSLAASEDTNRGVLNTILLSRCVKSINGFPVVGAESVRKSLSMRDRDEVLKEIDRRNPGPRLGEVSRPCSGCGESIALPLTLVDLFLF